MNGITKTLVIAGIIALASLMTTVVGYAGREWADNRYVTIASTERALLREYRLNEIDLRYLEKKGQITERQQLQLDQLRVDIEEIEEELE